LQTLLDSKGEAFLWKSAFWEKDWPKTKDFVATEFKSYTAGSHPKTLLRVTRLEVPRGTSLPI